MKHDALVKGRGLIGKKHGWNNLRRQPGGKFGGSCEGDFTIEVNCEAELTTFLMAWMLYRVA